MTSQKVFDTPLRVLDLFSGCGGMALGFHRVGARILGGVDIMPRAAESFALNFFKHDPEHFALHSQPRDIQHLPPQAFMRAVLAIDDPLGGVDVITGGPPCQAFARIGRAKLRQIMQDPKAHLNDGRANLYIHFLRYIGFFKPLVVVMENVPEMMRFGGNNVAEEVARSLEELGYVAAYTILNAAHYGVPQLRSRLYLIALREDIGVRPSFPKPSNYISLPQGYRNAYYGPVPERTPWENTHYVEPPLPTPELPPAVTVWEAIGDLPPIMLHLTKPIRGQRNFNTLASYARELDHSAFARHMRTWPGFESIEGVLDHVIRYLPRDHRIFKEMEPGDQYPEALGIANKLFQKELNRIRKATGAKIRKGSKEFERLKARYVPPYDPTKFPNRWRKLNPERPSHTLTAHLGKDTYSHIHYDAHQARVISVREAARLQSFPDGFKFAGAMNSAFVQIGNAVPPLQSLAIAEHIVHILRQAKGARDRAFSHPAYAHDYSR